MGFRLLEYYQWVGERKGLQGKVELAKITKIPSAKAAFEADSPENIEMFKRASEEITGQSPPEF